MYLCCVFTEQPSITVHPNGVTIREGQNVTLSCNASGNPVPTISWTRNGSPVKTSDHSRISFSDEEKLLTITNVSRTDRGEYRCVAINRVGNATSNVATVDVHCKYIHLIVWFNIEYARIFLELRSYEQRAKCPPVLYVKPYNKGFIIPLTVPFSSSLFLSFLNAVCIARELHRSNKRARETNTTVRPYLLFSDLTANERLLAV